jgi:CubicO group peptidase (beta-lactamase class C family)
MIHRSCCRVALTAIALCLPLAAGDLTGFDDFMAKAMETFKVPGAAIAVGDVEHKLPITGRTIFPIASITKSFT